MHDRPDALRALIASAVRGGVPHFIFSSTAATYGIPEVVPVAVRTAGFSLAYSLATAVFGGFTAAIATALIGWTGNRAAPGLWMAFGGACGLVATALIYRGASVERRALAEHHAARGIGA